MRSRSRTGVSAFCAALITAACAASAAADTPVKVAFWNVKSGFGAVALPGHPVVFSATANCTDATQPLNAWGVGVMQAELLAKIQNDPSVVALGVAESWACATPENIRRTLGWAAQTGEQNGVGLVARYGLAGPVQWQQLDTSLNTNPADTAWLLRAPVCLDAACSGSMPVFVAHWYGTGSYKQTTYDRQAQQTVAFLAATTHGEPHVLVGDLNVFESSTKACSQNPNNTSLAYLRGAGYIDAWAALYGSAEGNSGMVNFPGCGTPEGYTWKRIDYAWSPANLGPAGIERMGVPANAGDAAASDHFGIIAAYTLATATTPPPPPPPAPAPPPDPAPAPAPPPVPAPASGDIVLYAARATTLAGSWNAVADSTAAGGARMWNPDAGAAKIATPLAEPAAYFEMTFTPAAGQPYRLWLRGKAEGDCWCNDSVYAQFSGSLTQSGAATFRIGTTSATTVNLEEASGVGVSGWGWQDNGYGAGVLGPLLYFDGTPQTIRIQTREDGFSVDQIVLSPAQYLTNAPGPTKNDTTILPETSTAPAPAPIDLSEIVVHAASVTNTVGAWYATPDPTAADGVALWNPDAGAAKIITPAAAPASYVELTFQAEAGRAYRLWMRGRAEGDCWCNDSVFVQFSNAVDAGGAPVFRIGTTGATTVNLEDASGAGVSGWGWQDNGYGAGVLGPVLYFDTTGPQTIRIQVREDGFRFDQIVLSSQQYLTSSPGALKNDATILH